MKIVVSKTPEEMAEEYGASPHEKDAYLAGYQAAKDQLADFSKVMCNTTMEEIKAVDTGELMPITNLPTPAKWISVKDRLPEIGTPVLTCDEYTKEIVVAWRDECDEFLGMYDWVTEDRLLSQVTHWMDLPETPKEEK